GGLGIVHPSGGAENAVEDFRLHAVAVLIFQAQIGIAQPADPLLAVGVEPGRLHAIRAMDPARNVLAPRGAHAVDEPEAGALLRDPALALRPVLDVRHAVAHLGRSLRYEQIGRQPAEIEVAVGGDHLVTHGASRGVLVHPTARARASNAGPRAARSGRSPAP